MYFHLLVEDFIGFAIMKTPIWEYIASVVNADTFFLAEIGMISLI